MLSRILPHAKVLASEVVQASDTVIDGTCGNGHDTLFLAGLVPEGKVYSFDIQSAAIQNARERTSQFNNIEYILDSHANIKHYVTALSVLPCSTWVICRVAINQLQQKRRQL